MKKINQIFMRSLAIVLCTYAFASMSCSDDKQIGANEESPNKGIAVTSIGLTPKTVTMEVGESIPLDVTVLPENATDKSYT